LGEQLKAPAIFTFNVYDWRKDSTGVLVRLFQEIRRFIGERNSGVVNIELTENLREGETTE